MDDIQLFNDDCFNIFPTLEDKSINLFILDLPYGQTSCHWDSVIDLDEMWKHIKRIMKPNALIVFFCTAKFGNTLINANPKWFKYDLIWKKSRKVGFLSANRCPLRQHENIYVFKNQQGTYHPQKTKGKPYKTNETELTNSYYRGGAKEYKTLGTENKGDRHPTSIIDHENIYVFKDKQGTYHPQKTERDKDYKHSGKRSSEEHYGNMLKCKKEYKKEDGKHPTSIINHENIYVFDNTITDDIELSRNKDMREYAEKVYKFIGKGLKAINKKLGHRRVEHFFYFKSSQFGLCTNETYNQLIKEYYIDEMEEFLDYEILEVLWEKEPSPTYNPQKTEGKEYKSKERTEGEGVYIKDSYKRTATQDTKHRHPSSIIPEYEGDTVLVYKNPHKTIHRTQKPVELLEWLIKTYSNEGDTVMDFTMGSGTCAVGCMNTKRKFIGVEMDKEIYDLAFDRIEKHKKNL